MARFIDDSRLAARTATEQSTRRTAMADVKPDAQKLAEFNSVLERMKSSEQQGLAEAMVRDAVKQADSEDAGVEAQTKSASRASESEGERLPLSFFHGQSDLQQTAPTAGGESAPFVGAAGTQQSPASSSAESLSPPDSAPPATVSASAVVEMIHRRMLQENGVASPGMWQLHLQTPGQMAATINIEHTRAGDWELTVETDADSPTLDEGSETDTKVNLLQAMVDMDATQFCAELAAQLKVNQPELRFSAKASTGAAQASGIVK